MSKRIKISAVTIACQWLNKEYPLTPTGIQQMAKDLKTDYCVQSVEILTQDGRYKKDIVPMDLADGLCSRCVSKGTRRTCKYAITMSPTKKRCCWFEEAKI